eukprot:TRINITY_DN7841_c0_g1_i1.p1 TRINITY_DN7841_c0_g1~~TRINITY_DN7841_c0_g1_i1.p1  ORF type:complete len:1565 (-),score=216.37 TRINITY_DN7841_c0_g1_i1:61-4755(-)
MSPTMYKLLWLMFGICWAQLSIQSNDYILMEYVETMYEPEQTSTNIRDVAILKTTFDSTIYLNLSLLEPECSSYHNTKSILLCGPGVQCTDNKVTARDVDESSQYADIFFIGNPTNCSYFIVSATVFFGQTDLYLNVGGKRYSSHSLSSNYIYVCCGDVRNYNNGWDGTVAIQVNGVKRSRFHLDVYNDDIQLASSFYWVPSIVLDCVDSHSSNSYSCVSSSSSPPQLYNTSQYCKGVAMYPTPSPVSYYFRWFSGQNSFDDGSNLNNTLITQLILYNEILNNGVCYPFNTTIIKNCTVTYKDLVYKNSVGNYVKADVTPTLTKLNEKCDYDEFQQVLEGFDRTISKLEDNGVSYSFDTINMIVNELLSYTSSDAWAICNQKATSFLTPVTTLVSDDDITCGWDPLIHFMEYNLDPCCNIELQRTQCCLKGKKPYDKTSFVVNLDKLRQECIYPNCSKSTAQTLANINSQNNIKTCSYAASEELNSKSFSFNSKEKCVYQAIGKQCIQQSDCIEYNGKCVNSYCTFKCQNDSDCSPNTCMSDGYCQLPDYATMSIFQKIESYFACIRQSQIDSYVMTFFQQTYKLSNTPNGSSFAFAPDYASSFLSRNSFAPPSICGPLKILDIIDNAKDCFSATYCPWSECVTESVATSINTCTNSSCLDFSLLGDTNYCECNTTDCTLLTPEARVFTNCYVNNLLDEGSCSSNSYRFNPILVSPKYPCYSPSQSSSMNQCIPESMCSPLVRPLKGSAAVEYNCGPYCYMNLNETDCSIANVSEPNMMTTWDSWTINGTTYGKCKVVYTDGLTPDWTSCSYQYFHGKSWIDGTFDTVSRCGYCKFGITMDNQYDSQTCQNATLCTNKCKTCDTKEGCESSGVCSPSSICITPYKNTSRRSFCSIDTDLCDGGNGGGWSPYGCISLLNTVEECNAIGGEFIELDTKEKCESYAVCKDTSLNDVYDFTFDQKNPLRGYTAKNTTECVRCGNQMERLFSWSYGTFYQGTWVPWDWTKLKLKRGNWSQDSNQQLQSTTVDDFQRAITQAQARRAMSIVHNEMMCRYGLTIDSVDQLVCQCSGIDTPSCYTSYNSSSSTVNSAVGYFTICDTVSTTISTTGGSIIVPDGISFNGSECNDVTLYLVPASQLSDVKTLNLSSAVIQSTQTRAPELITIENNHSVIIGEWIGDGYSWNMNATLVGNIKPIGCINIPDGLFQSTIYQNEYYKIYDLIHTSDFINFYFLRLNLILNESSTNQKLCTEWENGRYYIPVGLIEDWESREYIQTWDVGVLTVLYVGVVLYFILGAISTFNLVLHLISPKLYLIPVLTLSLLSIFLFDRVFFFILTSTGTFASYPAAETVFSELPALIYLSVISIIALKWAEIYHFKYKDIGNSKTGQLKQVMIFSNAFIYLCFVLLLIVYFNLESETKYVDCTTSEEELNKVTSIDIVVYTYKAVYATASVIISGLVAYYGRKAIQMVDTEAKAVDNTEKRNNMNRSTKYLLMSAICSTTTMINAALLIGTSIEKNPNPYAILFILFIIELPSAAIIISLFSKTSQFITQITKSSSQELVVKAFSN